MQRRPATTAEKSDDNSSVRCVAHAAPGTQKFPRQRLLRYRASVIAVEIIVIFVAVIVAARSRPPRRHVSPRVMSLLAGVATVAFGAAIASIVIVSSERVFAISLLVAGAAGCAFLYLARGWAEDDDDDDGDDAPPPPPLDGDGEQRRFVRKRTRAPKTPAPR